MRRTSAYDFMKSSPLTRASSYQPVKFWSQTRFTLYFLLFLFDAARLVESRYVRKKMKQLFPEICARAIRVTRWSFVDDTSFEKATRVVCSLSSFDTFPPLADAHFYLHIYAITNFFLREFSILASRKNFGITPTLFFVVSICTDFNG